MRRFWWIIVCCAAAWVLLSPLLQQGVPQTQDGENHLARFAAYASAFRQGQLPPRWAPLLNGGYGYPVLNYGYPLANILATPFVLLKFSIEDIYKVSAAAAILLGAFGVWRCTRDIFVRGNAVAPWIGATAFLLHSYGWTNLFVRGSIGELWGWSILPLFFWFSWRAVHRSNAISIWGTFLTVVGWGLAHNVVSFLSAPVFFGWLMFLWVRSDRLQVAQKVFLPVALGLLSVSFFWIPAWFEKDLTLVTGTSLSSETAFHALKWTQVFFAPLSFGYSHRGTVDGMGLGGGVFALGVVLVAGITALSRKSLILTWVLFVWFLFGWLVSDWSEWFWNSFPGSPFIQFPWRILGVLQVVTAVLAPIVYVLTKPWLRILLFMAAIFAIVNMSRSEGAVFANKDDLYYKTFTQTTTVMNEYRAKTFLFKSGNLSPQAPTFSQEVGSLMIHFWNGSARKYSFTTDEAIMVEEPTMYFPGWVTKANGKEVNIETSLRGGLIAFELPAGTYTIETRFTQKTWPRVVGNSLTLFGLIGMLVYWWSFKRGYARR